jgi:hypothetical protein
MARPLSKQRKVEIEIEDGLKKEIILYEIRPIDLKKIFDEVKPGTTVPEVLSELLPVCSTLTAQDLQTFYPSDLDVIWKQFKSLNSVFFSVQERLRIFSAVLDAVLNQIQNEFLKRFATVFSDSSETDTAAHGGTDGQSSQLPSTNSESQKG